MPCVNCVVDGEKGERVWYCCNCHDGPHGIWIPSCTSCGHPIPTSVPSAFRPSYSSTTVKAYQVPSGETSIVPDVASRLESAKLHDAPRSAHHAEEGFDGLEGLRQNLEHPKVDHVNPYSSPLALDSPTEMDKAALFVPDVSVTDDSEQSPNSGRWQEEESVSFTETEVDEPDFEMVASPLMQAYIHDRARNVVAYIMYHLHFHFDTDSGIIRCTGGGSPQQPSTDYAHQDSGSNPRPARQANNNPNRGQRRKRPDEDDDQNGNRRGDRPPKKPKGKAKEQVNRLACHFFKRNPRRCIRHRACAGPGWLEIHHLREHLERDHRVYQCPRCSRAFPRQEHLEAHQREADLCILREERPVFGINEKKWEKIRARIKPGKKEEQWRAFYRIIFSETDEDRIPRAYYGPEDEYVIYDDDDFDLPEREEFYNQCRDQLPRRVQALLERQYRKRLTNQANDDSQELRISIDNQEFKETLGQCMQRALEEIQFSFMRQRTHQGPFLENGRASDLEVPYDRGQIDLPELDLDTLDDAVESTFPHPNDWIPETEFTDDFNIEDILNECTWDNITYQNPEMAPNEEASRDSAPKFPTLTSDDFSPDKLGFCDEYVASPSQLPLNTHAPPIWPDDHVKCATSEEEDRFRRALAHGAVLRDPRDY